MAFVPATNYFGSHDQAAVAVIANTSMTQESIVDWSRFSSFSKCVRVIAFCLRFKIKSQSKVLLPCEVKRAEEKVLKLIQLETSSEVFNGKQTFGNTSKSGDLAYISPFFDECGMIRIRRRIKHANLSFQQRHPFLLSTKHSIVSVMLRYLHLENSHEGVDYVRSVIQQKFWILR